MRAEVLLCSLRSEARRAALRRSTFPHRRPPPLRSHCALCRVRSTARALRHAASKELAGFARRSVRCRAGAAALVDATRAGRLVRVQAVARLRALPRRCTAARPAVSVLLAPLRAVRWRGESWAFTRTKRLDCECVAERCGRLRGRESGFLQPVVSRAPFGDDTPSSYVVSGGETRAHLCLAGRVTPFGMDQSAFINLRRRETPRLSLYFFSAVFWVEFYGPTSGAHSPLETHATSFALCGLT